MEAINLHFTAIFTPSAPRIICSQPCSIIIFTGVTRSISTHAALSWKRALDMNDRALRSIVSSLGGPSNGYPREDGFDITVASEIMAAFCLARDLTDLEDRLGRIIVAYTRKREAVTARHLNAHRAMTVLLKDALQPNLVQTLEGNPALVHGGPFANIAHGCNFSHRDARRAEARRLCRDRSGFRRGSRRGKFLDIKCRQTGLKPSAVVLVASIRALKMHGGVARDALGREDVAALESGFANLERHLANLRGYGLPVVVAINSFSQDNGWRACKASSALCARKG